MKKLSADCSQGTLGIIWCRMFCSSLLSKNVKFQIFGTVILPFVLCGYDTWSPTVSEEHRLRVFSNRVLRKVFGPVRNKVTGEWGI
jgi:hypothetical protein